MMRRGELMVRPGSTAPAVGEEYLTSLHQVYEHRLTSEHWHPWWVASNIRSVDVKQEKGGFYALIVFGEVPMGYDNEVTIPSTPVSMDECTAEVRVFREVCRYFEGLPKPPVLDNREILFALDDATVAVPQVFLSRVAEEFLRYEEGGMFAACDRIDDIRDVIMKGESFHQIAVDRLGRSRKAELYSACAMAIVAGLSGIYLEEPLYPQCPAKLAAEEDDGLEIEGLGGGLRP